jgi:hypothetical protein
MNCQQGLAAADGYAISAQERLGMASVFAGNRIDYIQYMQSTQTDISQIANRRSYDIQCTRWIMLRASCFFRRHQAPTPLGVQC